MSEDIEKLTEDVTQALEAVIARGFLGDKPGDEMIVYCEISEDENHEVLIRAHKGYPIEVRVTKKNVK